MVRLCNPADDERWDAYVSTNSHAHAYHHSAWRRILEKSFGHRTYYLMSEDVTGRVCGVLPLARLRSPLFGDFLVSLPYVNYAGCCADDEATSQALVAEAVRLAARLKVRHLELRSENTIAHGLRTRTAKMAMRLPLPDSHQLLWKSFPSKLRSQIGRAQREHLQVRIGRVEQFEAFYRVFAINMRDLGTPVYSKRFFRAILDELPHSTWICVVYMGIDPVAGGFLSAFRDTMEIPWASSLRQYNRFSPNMLLYWSVLKFATERGYRMFDFGRSSPESGPLRFKAQWGAAPVPLNWHYWISNGGPLPDLSPQNARYQIAVRLWRRLPVAVTRVIGPCIVKNLP
jgi:serine/alanine adding enzyme